MIDLERAVPDLERPPSHPGAGGVAMGLPLYPRETTAIIWCAGRNGQCRNRLGTTDGRHFFLKIKERRVTTFLPVSIRCERCGWQNPCDATQLGRDI